MARRTVLHDRHVRLGARIVDFHGWELPVQYEGVLAEHKHCRSAASVFDTSHMGQFLVGGAEVARELARVCTQDAKALAVGRCRYGFLLREDGGILDDTILMRLDEGEFLLVVNAGTADADLEWLIGCLPGSVAVSDLSNQGWSKIDLQGPKSLEALAPLAEADLGAMPYFSALRTRCGERECIVSRTGYTGELGYEIMAPDEDLEAIFDALLEHPDVRPAGLGARDSLRLEMGYPLYGQDLTPECNPLEAGLEAFVGLKRTFIGAPRLRVLDEMGLSRRLVAFEAATRRRANPGNVVFWGEKEVGVVTSGGFSPSLEKSIGLAYVLPELAEPGRELIADTGRAQLHLTVREKPLYKNGTCRAKTNQGERPS